MLELDQCWLQRRLARVGRNLNLWNGVKELRARAAKRYRTPINRYELQKHAIDLIQIALKEWEFEANNELAHARKTCNHVMVDAVPGAGAFGYKHCTKCGLTDL